MSVKGQRNGGWRKETEVRYQKTEFSDQMKEPQELVNRSPEKRIRKPCFDVI